MSIFQGNIHWVLDDSDKVDTNVRDPEKLFEFADKGLSKLSQTWSNEGPRGRYYYALPNDFNEGDLLAVKLRDFILLSMSAGRFLVAYAPHGIPLRSHWNCVREFSCTTKQVKEGLDTGAIERLIVSPFLEFVSKIVVN